MRFEVLGPVRATREGQVCGPLSHHRRRLLAVLLARANRMVGTDLLIDALWGDRAPRRPDNGLYVHVHRLRQTLDRPDRLRGVSGGYLLQVTSEELDASVFARLHADARRSAEAGDPDTAVALLREALALWRGAPYADVEEDRVVAPEARRLAETRLLAYEELFEAELARGRARDVVPELTELVGEYPLRERFVGHLMLALYRSGRQTRAEVAYKAACRRLAKDLRAEPGRELRDLYEAIRSEDPALDHTPRSREPARRPVGETVPVRSADRDRRTAPAQLPPLPRAFFGRERELAELEQTALDTDGGLVLLTGMAGIGKTGLAVRFAHQIADRFGDGQLHLDLRGHSPDPALDPLTALGHLLRGLGADPHRVWNDVAEATAEYRSLLYGRKVLVLLDNAASAEQVRPLLPATPGSLTLVTSRHRMSGLIAREGAHRIGLGELAPDAAHALLVRLVGEERTTRHPDQTTALVEACGRLPLALRIAAAQLADEPHRTLADYVSGLQDERLTVLALDDDERSAVTAAFDSSYRHLEPTGRRMFRLLGLVPGRDVTVEAAAAVAGTTVNEARALVRALRNAHLLDEHTAGRFSFHDLIREYARHRAESEETVEGREAALDRLFAWYFVSKQAATAHRGSTRRQPPAPVLPGGIPEPPAIADASAASGWLRTEITNLAAAARAAADRPNQAHWSWHLTVGLVLAMAEQGFATEALGMAETAVTAARAAQDRHALANVLTELGSGRLRVDLPVDDALVTEVLEHAEQTGDLRLLAYCLNFAAVVHLDTGEVDVAERYLRRALEIRRDDDDPIGQARILDNLGRIAYRRGDLPRTEQRYQEILELAEERSDMLTALALPNLIWARVMLGKVDGIDELIARAEEAVTRFGDLRIKAHILRLYRAIWYRNTGRHAEALTQASAAVRSGEELDQPVARSDAHYQLGLCRLAIGDVDDARRELALARELAASAQTPACLSPAARGLAETELAAGRGELALGYADDAVRSARGWSPVHLAGALVTLARVELVLDRIEDASAHGEQALEIHRRSGNHLGQARAHRVLGEAHRARHHQTGAEHLRHALRLFESFGSPEAHGVATLLRA